jgi:hypothetical protein
MRHWPIALISSTILNALLIAVGMGSYPRSVDDSTFQRLTRALGAPGGALTELLKGNKHPGASVVLDLLLSAAAVYVVIFWTVLTVLSLLHRRPASKVTAPVWRSTRWPGRPGRFPRSA